MLDKEAAIKRKRNIKKWLCKNYNDDELRIKLNSAIKHTHK
jgi:hypothetical protein